VELNELKELIRAVREAGVGEFELTDGSFRVRIRNVLGGASASATPVAAPSSAGPAPVAVAAVPASLPAATAAPVASAEPGLVNVPSPIVGTFYRAADPNAAPFVNVGDRVKVGQVLCIVEAMKLMNEIESDIAGEIVRIQPENGQPVQYGDVLFVIRP
jgi:acetyl-CoA carboxylase biotin carboxyl carrier protein